MNTQIQTTTSLSPDDPQMVHQPAQVTTCATPALNGETPVSDPNAPTRRISVEVSEAAYEQLRTAAIRLCQPNAEIVTVAIAEFVAKRNLMPLEGRERSRLRRRGSFTPEQEAEREEQARFAEDLLDQVCALNPGSPNDYMWRSS
jgi:hypothetical protein